MSEPADAMQQLTLSECAVQFADALLALGAPDDLNDDIFAWLESEDETGYLMRDEIDQQEAAATLRRVWPGDEYDRNVETIAGYMNTKFPVGVQNMLLNARVGSTRLLNQPQMLLRMLSMARPQ